MDNTRLSSASSAGEPAYTVAKSQDGYDIESQGYIVLLNLVGQNSLPNSDSLLGADLGEVEIELLSLPNGGTFVDEADLHVKALKDQT
jgi:hypothetical protein